MRTITGYRDGKAQWSENQPARGRSAWAGSMQGTIVVGHSVPKPAEPTSLEAMHKKAVRQRATVAALPALEGRG